MSDFTERQKWNTLRDLVKKNNVEIRSVFSVSTAARYNAAFSKNGFSKAEWNFQKNKAISDGLREIYSAVAEKVFSFNPEESQKFFNPEKSSKNWYDELSKDDLFNVYVFQNKVLGKAYKVEDLSRSKMLECVESTKFGRYFSGKFEFTGKPQRVNGEKDVNFDVENQENIVGVLKETAQDIKDKYFENNGQEPEDLTEEEYMKIDFGKYSGSVLKAYLKEKEYVESLNDDQFEVFSQSLKDENDQQNQNESEEMFTEQGTPIFKKESKDGSEIYQTSTGENYVGTIYAENEGDFFPVGETPEQQ